MTPGWGWGADQGNTPKSSLDEAQGRPKHGRLWAQLAEGWVGRASRWLVCSGGRDWGSRSGGLDGHVYETLSPLSVKPS